ncbi:MAG: sulfatase [Bacteroidetes bacterium 4572_77]|nr:MAG: sulfatase [Bacteroidetes bacterium 4572_77]
MKKYTLFAIVLVVFSLVNTCKKDNEKTKKKAPTHVITAPNNEQEFSQNETGGGGDLEWIKVSGGTFQMGSNNEASDEQPIHPVTLSNFEITKYEITNGEYCEFLNNISCNSNGSYNGTEYIDMDDKDCQINYSGGQFIPKSEKNDFPAIEISWYGSNAFAQWAGGRLPTEAEWEFAARGGVSASSTIYAGSNNNDDVAWDIGNSNTQTNEVGTKAKNELGIHDMSGNVWEWCNDWYHNGYYSISPTDNPQGPTKGSANVLRGGSWNDCAQRCRITNRYWYYPGNSYRFLGFRIAR